MSAPTLPDFSAPTWTGETVYEMPNIWKLTPESRIERLRFSDGAMAQALIGRQVRTAVRRGDTLETLAWLGNAPGDAGELGRWQVQAVKAFATAACQDILGKSKSVEPYVRRTVATLLGSMIGHEKGNVRVSRTKLANYIREVNPDLPPVVSATMDVQYVATRPDDTFPRAEVAAITPTSHQVLGGGKPVNWGYDGGGSRDFALYVAKHFQTEVLATEVPSQTFFAVRDALLDKISRADQASPSFVITGAQVANVFMKHLPELVPSPRPSVTDGQTAAVTTLA